MTWIARQWLKASPYVGGTCYAVSQWVESIHGFLDDKAAERVYR